MLRIACAGPVALILNRSPPRSPCGQHGTPRRARRRDAAQLSANLRNVPLLTPQTQVLHSRALRALELWLQRHDVHADVHTLRQCPNSTDAFMETCGTLLYADSAPLCTYLMSVTGLQAAAPSLNKTAAQSLEASRDVGGL